MLKPSQSSNLSPELQPLESRIKQDKSDFEDHERHRVAQEAKAERIQKKQVSCKEKKDVFQAELTQPDWQWRTKSLKANVWFLFVELNI